MENLKTTAFRHSQLKLVCDIDFVNQNTEFKEYQCSIASLQKDWNLDFSAALPYDTFEGKTREEIALKSVEEVVAHIQKHSKS